MKRMFAAALAMVPAVGMAEDLVANAELCAPYRKGSVVSESIAVYETFEDLQADSYQFLTVWFRPEYSWDLWAPPPESGLPRRDVLSGAYKRDLLFDINVADGQPVPLQHRRSVSPLEKTHFRLLLQGGIQSLPLERIVRNAVGAAENVEWKMTGETIYSFERVEVPDGNSNQVIKQDVYVEIDSSGALTAVMKCSIAREFITNPECEIYENTAYWLSEIGGIRRADQLDDIETIRQHARAFTACLTWTGEWHGDAD